MSRKRTDEPQDFPWKLFLSDNDIDRVKASEICSSKKTGALYIKKAVTLMGAGSQLGSKEINCEKIMNECNFIVDSQLSLVPLKEKEKVRKQLIDYYQSSLSHQFDSEIPISKKPDLPYVEREKVSSSANKSLKSTNIVKPVINIEPELEEKFDKPTVYKNEAIVWYYKNYDVKIKSADFVTCMLNRYPKIQQDLPKQILKEVHSELKGLKPSLTDYEKSVKFLNRYNQDIKKKSICKKPKVVSAPVEVEFEDEEEPEEEEEPEDEVEFEDEEEPEEEPEEEVEPEDEDKFDPREVLIDEAIVWYYENYGVKPTPKASVFKNLLLNKYPFIEKDSPKEVLKNLDELTGGKKPSLKDYNSAVDYLKKFDKYVKKMKEQVSEEEEEVEVEEIISVDEIKEFIKEKGWKPLKSDNESNSLLLKEELCRYIIKKITKEFNDINKEKQQKLEEYELLKNKFDESKTTYEGQLSILKNEDDTNKKSIKLLKKELDESTGKVSELERILSEIKKIQEKTVLTKQAQSAELERILSEMKKIQEQTVVMKQAQEESSGMCFQIKDWMDKDDFSVDVALSDLHCEDIDSACNIDIGKCIKNYKQKPIDLFNKRLIGSVKEIEKIKNKIDSKLKEIEYTKEKNVLGEILYSRIQETEPTLAGKITGMLLEGMDNTELLGLATSSNALKEKVNESLKLLNEPEPVEVEVKEEVVIAEPVEVKEIETCFTKESYDNVGDIVKDLNCSDSKVCNLDTKSCEDSDNVDNITEIQIGDKLVKVSGKDEIIKYIKNKIFELTNVSEVKGVGDVQQIIPAETKSLDQIVGALKNILVQKPVTTAQNKLKMTERESFNRLAKCIGVKF